MANGNVAWTPIEYLRPKTTTTTRVTRKGIARHTIVRAPSPPIRYELKSDVVQLDQRKNNNFNTRNKMNSSSSRSSSGRRHPETSFNPHLRPSRNDRGRSPTKRTPPRSSAGTGDVVLGNKKHEEDMDDTMSLISMTNLIAEDVCRMQNLRCDEVGPNTKHDNDNDEYNVNIHAPNNKTTVIGMNDANVIDFESKGSSKSNTYSKGKEKSKRNGTSSKFAATAAATSTPTKPYWPTVWDNPPHANTGYGTPETRSMNSGLSRSPGDSRSRVSSARMEVEVVDESDTISEITPTGCIGLDGKFRHRPTRRRRRRSHDGNNNNTNNNNNNNNNNNPEESFHEFMVSITRCLPTTDDLREIRKSFSDLETGSNGIILTKQQQRRGNSIERGNDCSNSSCCEHTRSFDGIDSSTYGVRQGYSNNNNMRRSRSHGNSRNTSGPAPAFKNNSDRYNQLVIGLTKDKNNNEGDIVHPAHRSTTTTQQEHRKYSPSWFKSRREVNKRRGNTRIVQPSQRGAGAATTTAVATDQHLNSNPPASGFCASLDEISRSDNVEVVWKQSKSFKEHKKILSSRGSVEVIPAPESQSQSILRKFLKRGKSKERKRQQQQQQQQQAAEAAAAAREATVMRNVSITANNDSTEWKTGYGQLQHHQLFPAIDSCNGTAIIGASDLAIDLCNSDTTMAIVGAAAAAASDFPSSSSSSDRRSSGRRRLRAAGGVAQIQAKKKNSAAVVTRTSITPSRKTQDPIWRGENDSEFRPRWPEVEPMEEVPLPPPHQEQEKPSTTSNTTTTTTTAAPTPPRKKRIPRCYHRNSEATDFVTTDDDDSGVPTMNWTKSAASYEEDDCGQDDVRVLSIVGHHATSGEREREHFVPSSFNAAGDSPFVVRDLQIRGAANARSKQQHSGQRNPASYSAYSTASSSSESSYPSSSSSSRVRLSRPPRKSTSRRLLPPGLSKTDMEAIRCLSENDKDAEFVAALSASTMANILDDALDDSRAGETTEGLYHSPWRNDFRAHVASKEADAGSPPRERSVPIATKKSPYRAGPTTPPKIQRRSSSDPFDCLDLHPVSTGTHKTKTYKETSPPRPVGIPRHKRMMS